MGGGTFYWAFYQQCQIAPQNSYDKYFSNCQNSNTTAKIEDMYNPIRVFYQNVRKGFCIAVNNGNFNKTLDSNFTVQNTSDFSNLVSQYKNVTNTGDKTFSYISNTFQN